MKLEWPEAEIKEPNPPDPKPVKYLPGSARRHAPLNLPLFIDAAHQRTRQIWNCARRLPLHQLLEKSFGVVTKSDELGFRNASVCAWSSQIQICPLISDDLLEILYPYLENVQMPFLTFILASSDENSCESSNRKGGDKASMTPVTTIVTTEPPNIKRSTRPSSHRIDNEPSAVPNTHAMTPHKSVRDTILEILGSSAATKRKRFIIGGMLSAGLQEMARAIMNAAPAARLPIRAVCKALLMGLVPVKRPLTNPKTNKAVSVKAMEINSEVDGLLAKM